MARLLFLDDRNEVVREVRAQLRSFLRRYVILPPLYPRDFECSISELEANKISQKTVDLLKRTHPYNSLALELAEALEHFLD